MGYNLPPPPQPKKKTTPKPPPKAPGSVYNPDIFRKPKQGPAPKPKPGPQPKPTWPAKKKVTKPKPKPTPAKKVNATKTKGGGNIKPKTWSGGGGIEGGGGGGGAGGFTGTTAPIPTAQDIAAGMLGAVRALPTFASNYLQGGMAGTTTGNVYQPGGAAASGVLPLIGAARALAPALPAIAQGALEAYQYPNNGTQIGAYPSGATQDMRGSAPLSLNVPPIQTGAYMPMITQGASQTPTGATYGPPTQQQAASRGTNAQRNTSATWTAKPLQTPGDIPGTEKRLANMLNLLEQPATGGTPKTGGKKGGKRGGRRYGSGYNRSSYRRYGSGYSRRSYRRSYYGGGGGGGGGGTASADDYGKFGIPKEYMEAYRAFWGQDQPQKQWSLYQPVMELFSRVMGRMPQVTDWQQIWQLIKNEYAARTPAATFQNPYANLVRYEPIINSMLPQPLFTQPQVSYAPGLSF